MTTTFPAFRAHVRLCIAIAWLLPPAFAAGLLQFLDDYGAPESSFVPASFGIAYVAIGALAASLLLSRYLGTIAKSADDFSADPNARDWRRIETQLAWFRRALLVSFAAYITPGAAVASMLLNRVPDGSYSSDAAVVTFLAMSSAAFVTAVPIFLRLSDLIGAYFAERGAAFVFLSVGAKVAALGLSAPLSSGVMMFAFFREGVGSGSTGAVAVCALLFVASSVATFLFWRSFRRSLAPLRALRSDLSPGHAFAEPKVEMTLRPGSLDEIGILVRDCSEVMERALTARDRIRDVEDRIRMITDSLSTMIAYVDSDERVQFVNARYGEWWHVDSEDIIGKTLSEFLPRELYTQKMPHIAAALAGVQTTDVTEYQYPDGKRRICEVRYVPHGSDDGAVLGYFVLICDVTEQRNAEQAAQMAHQRLFDAVESLPVGFALYDKDERLVVANSRRKNMTAWNIDLFAPGVPFEEFLRNTVASGAVQGVAKGDTAAGEAYIARRLAAFRNANGKPVELPRDDDTTMLSLFQKTSDGGTVAVMLDITERIRAEKRAEREHRRLLDVINSLPIGVRLFDQNSRLVHSNDKHSGQTHWQSPFMKPGMTYEDILRQSVASGSHLHDMESDEAYIEYRLHEFDAADGKPVERKRIDGRTALTLFKKTSDGETASVVIDITEQKRAESQALENHWRLHDAIESLPVGFRLFDADERLILLNSVQTNRTDWHGDLLRPGVTFEELLRNSVRKQMHIHDFASDEDYIAHRLKVFRSKHGAPIECNYANGRHGLSIYRRTSDGGTVTVEMDVTERVEAEDSAREANQRLMDAIESLPAGFGLFNKDEQLVLYNSRQGETTPWHRDMLNVGITFQDILDNSIAKRAYLDLDYDDPAAIEAFVTRRLEDFRNPQGASIEVPRSDGTTTLTVFRKTSDGGTVSIMLDITVRKQAEQALKASEGRLNAILDLAPEAIVTTDAHHRIQMFNTGAERLFGYKAEDVLGQNLETLIARRENRGLEANNDGASDFPHLASCLSGREETIALHESGRTFPVEISAAETSIDGAEMHTILLHDISERKRWEEEIRRALQLAETANRAKSEFLSHMSHELRTPLNGILGYAEFIRDKWLGDDALEQYVEYAGFISDSGQHLLQLINDILDLSKIESGQYELRFEEFNIDALFDECRLIVAADAQKARVAMNFEIHPESLRWTADRRALKQILINLLSNAVKFSAAGCRIDVLSSRDDTGRLRLRVRDTGVGMTEAEARNALEPFVQVGRPYVTQQKGTGLGLALVVQLATLHGGTVDIESKPDQGTTVEVAIPPSPRDTDAGEPPERIPA